MTFPLCTQCILTILVPSIILICSLTTSTDPLPLLRSSSFHVLGGICDLMVFIGVEFRSVGGEIFTGVGHLTIGCITEENSSPSPSNHKLPINLHRGLGPHESPFFLWQRVDSPYLIPVLDEGSRRLLVQECNGQVMPETQYSTTLHPFLCPYILSTPSSVKEKSF